MTTLRITGGPIERRDSSPACCTLNAGETPSPNSSCFAAKCYLPCDGPFVGPLTEVQLTSPSRLAFIGNSLPRRCGIATFTTDLQQAIAASRVHAETAIVAMTDHGHSYDYPPVVCLQVNDDSPKEYAHAADFLNEGHFDIACLQHEFGIFGGESGNHIMALLSRLTMPIITTLHTVLAEPRPAQRSVLNKVVGAVVQGHRHGREGPGPAAHGV